MNTKNLFIADPFNDEHIKLFKEFESINNDKKPVYTYLTGIRKAYNSKEAFKKVEDKNNELNVIAFTMADNKMKDYCYIKGEKDRKVCELFFAQLNSAHNSRPIMQRVSNYVLDIMGMEQVYVSLTGDEKKLYSQLINHGYEDIGEVNGKIVHLDLAKALKAKRSLREELFQEIHILSK